MPLVVNVAGQKNIWNDVEAGVLVDALATFDFTATPGHTVVVTASATPASTTFRVGVGGTFVGGTSGDPGAPALTGTISVVADEYLHAAENGPITFAIAKGGDTDNAVINFIHIRNGSGVCDFAVQVFD